MKRGVMCVAVFCLVAGSAFAGEPITIGETITMPSKIMGEERTILISTPPGSTSGTGIPEGTATRNRRRPPGSRSTNSRTS